MKNAAYILNKIDTTVDPCDDFYTFSCGNWLKQTPFPPSKTKYGSFGVIGDEIEKIMKEVWILIYHNSLVHLEETVLLVHF